MISLNHMGIALGALLVFIIIFFLYSLYIKLLWIAGIIATIGYGVRYIIRFVQKKV